MKRELIMDEINKVTENLLRRIAKRQGFNMYKNRGRDPRGLHYGTYRLNSIATTKAYYDKASGGVWLSAPAVARALGREDLMTNGDCGNVKDKPPVQLAETIPVVALHLVPELTPTELKFTESGDLSLTLVLSSEKAAELAEQIRKQLDQREYG